MKIYSTFIITLLMFSPILTWAQQDINAGLQAGMNYSLFNKNTDSFAQCDSCKGTIGFTVGYFETLELNDKWQLEANINFTQNSFKNDESDEARVTYNVQYIDVPLLLRYKSGNFRIGFGGQYRWGLSGKTESDSVSSELESEKDMGIVVDSGIQQGNFRIGIRYYRGFEDVIVPTSVSSISLTLGVAIF